MNILDLEKQLALAEAHLASRLDSLAGSTVEISDYEAVSVAQRALAAARNEEYAEPLSIGFEPEAAVSEAVLLQTERAAFLTFSAVRETYSGKREDAGYGIVELLGCSLTKFGYPNDEALPGHPLYKKGLSGYGVFEVKNSVWLSTITEQNRVAFPHTPDSSDRHLIIVFHDSTFECVTQGFQASLSTKAYSEIFDQIRERVLQE
jgi:hypothetical protein